MSLLSVTEGLVSEARAEMDTLSWPAFIDEQQTAPPNSLPWLLPPKSNELNALLPKVASGTRSVTVLQLSSLSISLSKDEPRVDTLVAERGVGQKRRTGACSAAKGIF